jgi:hypothetical protein
MNIEDQLGLIIDAAEQQEKTTTKAVSALAVAVKRLETTSETLKTGVEGAISENMWKVQQAAKESLLEASKTSTERLIEASNAVIASQKQFSVWWIVAPVAAILGFAAMACLGVWLATMSWRAEIVEMRATVAQLEAKGGRAKLSTCEGKQCVAIELLPEGKVYGSKKDPYLVLRY